MKRITDERLVIRNLKNIRIAYFVQTLGIIGILVFDAITKGLDGMRSNPLWFVFMATTIIFAYLSISISVENETTKKSPLKNFILSVIILLVISIIIGFFVMISEGFGYFDGLLIGGIIFICGMVPALYIFRLRNKRLDETNKNL